MFHWISTDKSFIVTIQCKENHVTKIYDCKLPLQYRGSDDFKALWHIYVANWVVT